MYKKLCLMIQIFNLYIYNNNRFALKCAFGESYNDIKNIRCKIRRRFIQHMCFVSPDFSR